MFASVALRTILCQTRQSAHCLGCNILRPDRGYHPVQPLIHHHAISHEARNKLFPQSRGLEDSSWLQRRTTIPNSTQSMCSSYSVKRYKCTHPKIPPSDPESPVEEWIHPDDREEGPVTRDSELKALLKELVSDFETEGDQNSQQARADNMEQDVVVDLKGIVLGKKTEGVEQEVTKAPVVNRRTKRGLPPVFTLDAISELLREENASDMCVIKVPPERGYVDYFIVVTARSTRHLIAMTQSINKVYKARKSKKHPFIIVEGRDSDDWQCIDFGNIVVHFMLSDVRELYELEKLWLLGAEYDEQYQRMQEYKDSLRQALMEDIPEQGEGGKEGEAEEGNVGEAIKGEEGK